MINRPLVPIMRALILAVLVLATPLAAAAQGTPRDTTSLSPVVVTATRTGSVGTSTAATTVVSGEELRRRGIVHLADALRLVPGIVVSAAGGEGAQSSLFLRGGNSNFTKVVIDGIPVNAPGGAIDLSTLMTDNIERIEIVRGAGSALHGSDAMTGVIQIFTRSTPGSLAEARVGSRDALRDVRIEHAGIGVARGLGSVGWSIGGGDHRGNGALAFNNEFRNSVVRGRVEIDGARARVAVAAGHSSSRYHYPTDGGGAVVDSNAVTGLDRTTVSVSTRVGVTERAALHIDAGTTRDHAMSQNDPDSPGDVGGFYSRSVARGQRSLVGAHVGVALPATLSLVVGGAGEWQAVRSRGRDSFTPQPYTFDETRANRAIYAQVAGGTRLFSFDVSGRRESYRELAGVKTGRAGVASELRPGTVVRASIGRGFKEPALDQLYNTSFAVGNAALLPERSRVIDFGGETRLGPIVLGATWFRQRFTDLIQYRFDVGNPAAPNYYNVAAARADGVELEGRIDPWHGFGLRGSYTLLETGVTRPGTSMALEAGKPLFRRPRRKGSIASDWLVRGATVHGQVERVGARDDLAFAGFTANRVRLDPYTLLTLAAELPLARGNPGLRPSLVLRGENLGAARYQNAAGFDMPGRTVHVGVRARW